MDIINLVLYKEAKKVAEQSNGAIRFEGFYDWLLEVKRVQPNLEKVLLKKSHRKANKL